MKFLVAFLFITSGVFSQTILEDEELPVMTQSEIDYINSIQSSWVAGHTWVSSMKLREAKSFIPESEPQSYDSSNQPDNLSQTPIPASYMANSTWPTCVTPIQNQGGCSASYAFAATAVMSERACINNIRYSGVLYSSQNAMACSTTTMQCSGGTSLNLFNWIQQNGIGLANCQAWTGSTTCSNVCDNGTPVTLFYVKNIVQFSNAAAIQNAIMAGGAVTSSMTVYKDFTSYTGGVYTWTYGGPVGSQSVKIFGWGVNGSGSYWVCSNSWGTTWGMQGYFQIQFGQCKIDVLGVGASATN
ncbi:hypothetical protein SteCoe_1885 [Stentor coeruleus]|uniref:Peptidase C1A papain C-terminal domain-containing protein n=1 Tax=Stentor coeruleus TaxID=5963 RepID=A0A1R2D0R8_9CILI|nr:hypothetical protein SteCoe_1885 [Stentor coeruleus]